MSFEVTWYLPQRIIYVHILKTLVLSEIEAMSETTIKLMSEGIAPVHILLDDSKGGRPPINLSELRAHTAVMQHPAMGWIVGIGEVDPVAKFLIPLLLQLAKLQFVRLKTIEAAVEFLIKNDVSLQVIALND